MSDFIFKRSRWLLKVLQWQSLRWPPVPNFMCYKALGRARLRIERVGSKELGSGGGVGAATAAEMARPVDPKHVVVLSCSRANEGATTTGERKRLQP
jgi:hypothetical protein